ncbi:2359_t:CDS:2 [Diversispora eburnea]|uniref:2359_t:CDS:1 n=1 Tax=Diversispora eburnea TaxID=1213867 RepID=A0A9N8V0G0_9GLOM|nr:2359_t:CDS:2 [Diversispora eburnea]
MRESKRPIGQNTITWFGKVLFELKLIYPYTTCALQFDQSIHHLIITTPFTICFE